MGRGRVLTFVRICRGVCGASSLGARAARRAMRAHTPPRRKRFPQTVLKSDPTLAIHYHSIRHSITFSVELDRYNTHSTPGELVEINCCTVSSRAIAACIATGSDPFSTPEDREHIEIG